MVEPWRFNGGWLMGSEVVVLNHGYDGSTEIREVMVAV